MKVKIIAALLAHGYDLEDARDYVVAACWEFIIPGRGMEVVNTGHNPGFLVGPDGAAHEFNAAGTPLGQSGLSHVCCAGATPR